MNYDKAVNMNQTNLFLWLHSRFTVSKIVCISKLDYSSLNPWPHIDMCQSRFVRGYHCDTVFFKYCSMQYFHDISKPWLYHLLGLEKRWEVAKQVISRHHVLHLVKSISALLVSLVGPRSSMQGRGVNPRLGAPERSGVELPTPEYSGIGSQVIPNPEHNISIPEHNIFSPINSDRKSTRLNSSHVKRSRMPSSAWKKKT